MVVWLHERFLFLRTSEGTVTATPNPDYFSQFWIKEVREEFGQLQYKEKLKLWQNNTYFQRVRCFWRVCQLLFPFRPHCLLPEYGHIIHRRRYLLSGKTVCSDGQRGRCCFPISALGYLKKQNQTDGKPVIMVYYNVSSSSSETKQ